MVCLAACSAPPRVRVSKLSFTTPQVFRHKKYGYRAVVYGWDRSCDRDPQWAQEMGVRAEQPFAAALPDEGDCLRIFGGVRISK